MTMKLVIKYLHIAMLVFAMASCGGSGEAQDKAENKQGKAKEETEQDDKLAFNCDSLLTRYEKLIADIKAIDDSTNNEHIKMLQYRTKDIYDEIQYYLEEISPECVKKIEALDKEFFQIVDKLAPKEQKGEQEPEKKECKEG